MAVFGIKMKKRNKAVGGFHAQYIDKTPKKKRAPIWALIKFYPSRIWTQAPLLPLRAVSGPLCPPMAMPFA